MLKIVFFARVKESLKCAELLLDWNVSLSSFTGLQEHLYALKGKEWRAVLEQDNIIRAVNHTVVTEDIALKDGDEVAYYPPVTGG
ncbi:MAG: molybdopterin synthase sulfur carrier subunit [Halieaceae bacterium]|jgi:sulfur-carrier protein|nr:molybdopterin synthase sulfur carrier subunit [Halieaceae bacterium]